VALGGHHVGLVARLQLARVGADLCGQASKALFLAAVEAAAMVVAATRAAWPTAVMY
jgi:hypothetical protein